MLVIHWEPFCILSAVLFAGRIPFAPYTVVTLLVLCMLALFAVQSAHTCCCQRPESSLYVLSEIEENARSSKSQSTENALYDLCSIFLQRFEVFQGVRDGVQLIVEGVWLVESVKNATQRALE